MAHALALDSDRRPYWRGLATAGQFMHGDASPAKVARSRLPDGSERGEPLQDRHANTKSSPQVCLAIGSLLLLSKTLRFFRRCFSCTTSL